jgi:hypothetical protein
LEFIQMFICGFFTWVDHCFEFFRISPTSLSLASLVVEMLILEEPCYHALFYHLCFCVVI